MEKCRRCRTYFHKIRDWQVFCSDKCRKLYHQEEAKRAVRLLRLKKIKESDETSS